MCPRGPAKKGRRDHTFLEQEGVDQRDKGAGLAGLSTLEGARRDIRGRPGCPVSNMPGNHHPRLQGFPVAGLAQCSGPPSPVKGSKNSLLREEG